MSGTAASGAEARLGRVGRLVLVAVLAAGTTLGISDPISMFFFLSYASIGAILVVRRPRNPIGWLLLMTALCFVGTTVMPGLDTAALIAGTAPWRQFLSVWLASFAGYAAFACLLSLTLVFPSGTLPLGRRGAVARLLIGGALVVPVLAAFGPTIPYSPGGGPTAVPVPNRLALAPDLALWSLVPHDFLVLPLLVFLGSGVAVMLARYRRSAGVERLQLRWLAAGMLAVVLAIIVGLVSTLIVGPEIGVLAWIPAMIAYPSIPAAIYIAITRHRLYEIDRIVSRTIGWVLVTVLLAGVFVLAILALQAALSPFTNNDTLAVAASTLLAAASFQPLRHRVQAVVDRRFNRARVDAQRTVDAFATRVREDPDLDTVRRRLVAAASGTMQPERAALWIRAAGPDR